MKALSLLAIILLSTGAKGDIFPPSHSCSKPFKPYSFTSEYELNSYKDDIESYKRCIENFVEEQQGAIKKHQEAANDAISEYNSFVSYGY